MGAVRSATVMGRTGTTDGHHRQRSGSGRIWAMPAGNGTPDGDNEDAPDAGTARSLAMLLDQADLAGHGWEVSEERTWPTGGLDPFGSDQV